MRRSWDPDEATKTMFRKSYAVLWQEGDGAVSAGKLLLGPSSLRLESGIGSGRTTARVFRYDDLTGVEMARPTDRIRSSPTVLVRRKEKERLGIAAVDGMGSVREIVERLTAHMAPKAAA
jgi:hypothetical protein